MPNANILTKKDRVIAYIDGFNLYFGINEAGLTYCKWLNIKTLITHLLLDDQELVGVKYFTSRINNEPEKQKRQNTFIEAIETTGISIFYGNFIREAVECSRCGKIWSNSNEKMTDVNIATNLLIDAFQDKYDVAILISGDSDLVPPIKSIHTIFPGKRVTVAFPPKRFNNSLQLVARGSMIIGRRNLVESQFPNEVTKADGFILRKPSEWK